MKFNDSRSFRMVIIADYFLNPQQYERLPNSPHVYECVRDSGYGIIKMPPLAMPKVALTGWISSVADQIQEYGNRGFTVLLVGMNSLPGKGVWASQLKKELSARGVEMPATKNLSPSDVASRDSTKKSLGGFLR
ncbi:MAG: hypothetical protein E6K96_08050 [Thaumarchaeota archaeon]|nr:MAG: hypothetical protein E6K96_08050 [Nitrososphaerota archaeon]